MSHTATAWITTSRRLSERQVRALDGTARELNSSAVVTTGEANSGIRLDVTQLTGDAARARVECYRVMMQLVYHAGLDVVDARSEVVEQP